VHCYRKVPSWVPVAHAYNPSYSGGRDREDYSSKPAWVNSSEDLISKNLSQRKTKKNRVGGVAQSGSRWRPWVQTLVPQKKKSPRYTTWAFFTHLANSLFFSVQFPKNTRIYLLSKGCGNGQGHYLSQCRVQSYGMMSQVRTVIASSWYLLSLLKTGPKAW
jgi:hypothetical protein